MGKDQTPDLAQLIQAARQRMWIDFEQKTAQLSHPGEKGAAREDVVRAFLSDHLPKRYAIGSGFVVDAAGRVSRQIDIVLYDHLATPVFPVVDRTGIFPVEGVAGVVSVKSHLDAKALRDATDNLLSVLRLDKLAGGKRTVLFGGVHSPFAIAEGDRPDPIMTAILAYEGIDLERLAHLTHERFTQADPLQRLQLVSVLSKGAMTWRDNDSLQPTINPAAKVAWVEDPELSLLLFFTFLANGMMKTMPILPNLNSYLRLTQADVNWLQ